MTYPCLDRQSRMMVHMVHCHWFEKTMTASMTSRGCDSNFQISMWLINSKYHWPVTSDYALSQRVGKDEQIQVIRYRPADTDTKLSDQEPLAISCAHWKKLCGCARTSSMDLSGFWSTKWWNWEIVPRSSSFTTGLGQAIHTCSQDIWRGKDVDGMDMWHVTAGKSNPDCWSPKQKTANSPILYILCPSHARN